MAKPGSGGGGWLKDVSHVYCAPFSAGVTGKVTENWDTDPSVDSSTASGTLGPDHDITGAHVCCSCSDPITLYLIEQVSLTHSPSTRSDRVALDEHSGSDPRM